MFKSIILSAGKGTRLKPLTDKTPKPLLDINGKPMLYYILKHLEELGFNDVLINAHYLSDQINKFCCNSGTNMNIECITESKLLGTAGSVLNAKEHLDSENFLVHYGDIICFEDYRKMYQRHIFRNALCTILVHRGESNSIVNLGKNYSVKEFIERPKEKIESWVNSGVYIFNKKIFNYIDENDFDLPKDIFPKLLKNKEKFYAYPLTEYRIAIDSIKKLDKARECLTFI